MAARSSILWKILIRPSRAMRDALEVELAEPFPWQDLGEESAAGLRFHGALLTANLGAVLGEVDTVTWGYGP